MNAVKNKYDGQETFIIPCDIFLEAAQIIVQAELPHEITGVLENKNQVRLSINYQPDLKYHQQAIKNLNDILEQYRDLRNGESETVNWKES